MQGLFDISVMQNQFIKVTLLGDSGTGKTCILHGLSGKPFQPIHNETIGLDFANTLVTHKGKCVQLWDTAGQRRLRPIKTHYLQRSEAFVIVVDVTNPEGLSNFDEWVNEIKYCSKKMVPVMILGNKSEIHQDRRIGCEAIRELAETHKYLYEDVSALTGENLDKSLMRLLDKIIELI